MVVASGVLRNSWMSGREEMNMRAHTVAKSLIFVVGGLQVGSKLLIIRKVLAALGQAYIPVIVHLVLPRHLKAPIIRDMLYKCEAKERLTWIS
jgi:hypothetical protein